MPPAKNRNATRKETIAFPAAPKDCSLIKASVVRPMTTMMPPSLANQLVPSASSRAEIAFMRSFIVGRGAGVRRGENGGGVEMRADTVGGIAAGCGGGIVGVCAIAGGTTTFGGAGGRVGFDSGTGACGAGASGLGSIGFGSVGVTGGTASGVAITGGTGKDVAGICGFSSGAVSGFFSGAGIGAAVCGLIGGWISTRGGTA